MKFSFLNAAVVAALGMFSYSAVAQDHGILVERGDALIPYADLQGEPVTLSRGTNLEGSSNMSADLVATKVIMTPTPYTRTLRVFKETKCTGGSKGDGTKGDWKGYFEAKKADKPAALAAAVRGIGKSTARQIVEDGQYFKRKPRSWDEFRDEIWRIQNDLKLPVVENVLGNAENARANFESLGYRSEGGVCEDIWEDRTFIDFKLTPVPIGTVKKRLQVNITGAPLLKGESEQFGAVLVQGSDGQPEVQLSVPSHYNTHNLARKTDEAGQTTYDFKSQRNQIRPSPDMVQVTPRVENGVIKFQITNNQTDAGGDIQVNVSAATKTGLFKSGRKESSFTLNGENGLYDSGQVGVDGKRIYYSYDIQVTGSPYFSNTRSSSKSQ
jgi:hypothetical protein